MPEKIKSIKDYSSEQEAVVKDFKVHTMPEKFLSIRPTFKLGKAGKTDKKPMSIKKNLIIGIIVAIVLGGLMVLAAWLFLKSVDQDQPSTLPAETDYPAAVDDPAEIDQPISPPQINELPSTSQSLLEFDTWLAFDNATYKYSLKYPTDWSPDENNNPTNALQLVTFNDQSDVGHFAITTFSNPQQQPLTNWLKVTLAIDEIDLESFSLHNYSAYKYEDQLANQNIVYITFDQKIYSLAFPKTDDNTYNQAYAQILINFKFSQPLEDPQDQPPVFTPAVDSDQDNLTDIEEALYGTQPDKRDTDGDSYIDGEEVANLYDPTISGNARLYNSQLVSTYVSGDYNYNIIYPAAWTAKDEGQSVIFQDQNGEFIQVLITQNQHGFNNITEWYQANINPNISNLSNLTIDNQPAIRTADNMNAYFLLADNIYSLIYNIGLSTDPNFMTTFDMMLKSFRLMSSGN